MKAICALLVCGFCLSLPAAALEANVNPIKKLTPPQVDRILVLDHLNTRDQDTRRLAAVAYTVHNGQMLLANQANRDNLLQSVTPTWTYDKDTQFVVAGPSGTIYPLDQIAARKAAQLDGYTLRGSALEKTADFAVDAIALGTARKYPTVAGAVKLLYPPIKEGVTQLVERDPRAPNFDRDFTIEWATWAYNEVRKGSPEGLALSQYVLKYQDIDPRKDNSHTQAVQDAENHLLLITGAKDANEAVQKLHDLAKVQSEIGDGVKAIRDQLSKNAQDAAAATEAAKSLADRVRPVQNIAGSLQLTSYLFSIAGNEQAARTMGGLSNAASGVANLMQSAATAAPMALAAGYVGVAIAVVSAFQSSKEGPSPFPAIFQMLQQISVQIENLRMEVANSVAALDTHLSSMIAQNTIVAQATNFGVDQLRQGLTELGQMLEDVNKGIQQQVQSNSNLILNAEDRNCFQRTGTQELLPLTRKEFINCRDTYIDRATAYAVSGAPSYSLGSISTTGLSGPARLFPFADDYETLRNDLHDSQVQVANPLKNPAIWFRSATLLMALIQNSSSYPWCSTPADEEALATRPEPATLPGRRRGALKTQGGCLSDIAAPQLDPVIEAGEDIRKFVETIAVEKKDGGAHLRKERFNLIVDEVSALQNAVLDKAAKQIENGAVPAVVPQGLSQAPNLDNPYQMLATKGLKFCDKVVATLKSVESLTGTYSGGAHGTNRIWYPAPPTPGVLSFGNIWKNVRDSTASAIQGFDYRRISFDNSILRVVKNAIVLAEQIKYKGAEMSYCVSQFDVNRLKMDYQQTLVDLFIRVQVFLTIHETSHNTTFLVQELTGTAKTVTPPYNLFYDASIRPDNLILQPWAQLQAHFDNVFVTSPNEEADSNYKHLEEDMNTFFADQQNVMYSNTLSSIELQKNRITRLKTDLLALTMIGLDARQPAVKQWLTAVDKAALLFSSETVVRNVILNGQKIDDAKNAVAQSNSALKAAIDTLSASNSLGPSTDAISARLTDLRKVLSLRATLVTANRSAR